MENNKGKGPFTYNVVSVENQPGIYIEGAQGLVIIPSKGPSPGDASWTHAQWMIRPMELLPGSRFRTMM